MGKHAKQAEVIGSIIVYGISWVKEQTAVWLVRISVNKRSRHIALLTVDYTGNAIKL
jgi:hypothetical protein